MGNKRDKPNKQEFDKKGSVDSNPEQLDSKAGGFIGFSRKVWLFALAPALLGALLYANTINHDYVLDDLSAITKNNVVKKGTDELGTIFTTHYRYGYWNQPGSLYRPMALALFAVQWEYWPNDASVAHFCNIVLYAVGILLLFFLLYQWFGRGDPWLPAIICAVFAAHPIHTEVVANIKSADELLAVGFSLASLLCLWKYLNSNGIVWLAGALVLFLPAMLSKESTITILPLIPLSIWFFTDTKLQKNLIVTAMFVLPIAVYFLMRKNAIGTFGSDGEVAMIDNITSGMSNSASRFATAVKLSGLYLWKLIVPHPLSHDYSFNEIKRVTISSWEFWVSLAAYTGIIVVGLLQLRKKRLIGFAIAFFLITFALYSNVLITIGTHFGERLLYLPSIGFAIALGYGIYGLAIKAWQWKPEGTRLNVSTAAVPMGVLAVLLLSYSFKTVNRNTDWASEMTLYRADIENAPESSRTYYRLGLALRKESDNQATAEHKRLLLTQCVEVLEKALDIYPKYNDVISQLGLAHHQLRNREKAIEYYNQSLEANPSNYTTYNNRGSMYFELGMLPEAISDFHAAIQLYDRHVEAMGNLASAYGQSGDFENAVIWFNKALEIDPNNASYYHYLAITYENMKRPADAQQAMQKACELSNNGYPYCQPQAPSDT